MQFILDEGPAAENSGLSQRPVSPRNLDDKKAYTSSNSGAGIRCVGSLSLSDETAIVACTAWLGSALSIDAGGNAVLPTIEGPRCAGEDASGGDQDERRS